MTWLRLMRINGTACLVNSGQISDVYAYDAEENAAIRGVGGTTIVRESVSDITAMIEQAEWRERVLRCGCAIMSSTTLSSGLTSEQVWARAARFATMEPERPGAA